MYNGLPRFLRRKITLLTANLSNRFDQQNVEEQLNRKKQWSKVITAD